MYHLTIYLISKFVLFGISKEIQNYVIIIKNGLWDVEQVFFDVSKHRNRIRIQKQTFSLTKAMFSATTSLEQEKICSHSSSNFQPQQYIIIQEREVYILSNNELKIGPNIAKNKCCGKFLFEKSYLFTFEENLFPKSIFASNTILN